MTLTTLGLIAPLIAAALILSLRRWPAAIALLGVAIAGVVAAVNVARVDDGSSISGSFGGLPGHPLWIDVTPLTAALALTVVTTGFLVLVYAVGYMAEYRDHVRFYSQMTFFIGAMQLLVLAGDWILFVATWELIALASYLLIAFEFSDRSAGWAGTRAFLTTRVSDLGLYLGVILLINEAGSIRIPAGVEAGGDNASIAALLLLVGAMGKAAQVPFQRWLEEAMAGPTPVSALLHSATLVAAGVILLVRAFPLFSPNVLIVIGLVGGVTTVVTGLIALQEGDLKRMLAASTSSQLALMLVAIGAGSWAAAIVHLVAHAAMKSALFLGAGIFQHARESTAFDDLRGIGRGQRKAFAGFAVAGLALAGVPPLVGFWSKEAIVTVSIEAGHAWLFASAALAGTALTGAYIGRGLRLLWFGESEHESPAGLSWMLAGLAATSGATVVLAAGVRPFESYLDAHIPIHVATVVLSVLATGLGLAGGWLVATEERRSVLEPIDAVRARLTGLQQPLVIEPALRLAASCDRVDTWLQRRVEAVGSASLYLSGLVQRVDDRDHAGVEATGRAAMSTGWLTRRTDDDGIDRFIAWMVADVRKLGGRAREIQTGLISRELAYSAAAVAVLVAILLGAGWS
ncbi:MAG: proton-conducting transporter membrane subunit [Thermomicrobiales bacterium]